MDEKTRLPSSVTITMPPGNLICLVTPPKVDPLGEDDWGDVGRDGREFGRAQLRLSSLSYSPSLILTSDR